MRQLLDVGAILAFIAVCSLSIAEASPRETIEDFHARAITIVTATASVPQARDDRRDLVRGLFDGLRVAQRALGPEWDNRTAAERDEFARLFTNALERTWLAMVQAASALRCASRWFDRVSPR